MAGWPSRSGDRTRTMNCEQAHNLFDVYLDGELPSALETEVQAHRLQCPSCRHELALMEVAGHVIASGEEDSKAPAEFADRLLACLVPEVSPSPSIRMWVFRIGGSLAAAACIILLVGQFMRPGPRVAGRTELNPRPPVVQPAEALAFGAVPPRPERMNPDLNDAAAALRETMEGAVLETRQSSASLMDLGRSTLLQMIDAMRLELSRSPDEGQEAVYQPILVEDADEVEEL